MSIGPIVVTDGHHGQTTVQMVLECGDSRRIGGVRWSVHVEEMKSRTRTEY